MKMNRAFLGQISEFYMLGYSYKDIAKLLDCHYETIYRYLQRHPEYKDKNKKLRRQHLKGIMERGLQALAEGVKVEEVTELYEIVDDDGSKRKISKTTKTLPPNVKAIEVLARKYDSMFSAKELKQINNVIMTENPISMRELLEYKDSKDNPINADYIEIGTGIAKD